MKKTLKSNLKSVGGFQRRWWYISYAGKKNKSINEDEGGRLEKSIPLKYAVVWFDRFLKFF